MELCPETKPMRKQWFLTFETHESKQPQTLKIGQASPGPGAQPSPYKGPVDYIGVDVQILG